MKLNYEEELKKGCGKDTKWCNIKYKCGMFEDLKHSWHIILCPICEATLKGYQKAKDEFKQTLNGLSNFIMDEDVERIDILEKIEELKSQSEDLE